MEACPVPSWSGRQWRQWERLPDLMDRSGIEGEEKDREEGGIFGTGCDEWKGIEEVLADLKSICVSQKCPPSIFLVSSCHNPFQNCISMKIILMIME